jgi:pimeloyl-ACP methyl ester carboxylesterase
VSDAATPDFRHVEVNGVSLAYNDVGEGPTILFIHGFMLDRTMWRSQVAALDGWRRIAPNLRGHGLSEAPEGGYRMATYADDLAALLDVLGVRRTVLCGLSMGGISLSSSSAGIVIASQDLSSWTRVRRRTHRRDGRAATPWSLVHWTAAQRRLRTNSRLNSWLKARRVT